MIVVGNSSDDPFAIDVAFAVGQTENIADLISMKTFANSARVIAVLTRAAK